jgi:predicted transcriptional regulator
MTRSVEVVSPEDPIQKAARKMKDLDVGPMPVCDGERLVSKVTDGDHAIGASMATRSLLGLSLWAISRPKLPTR